jgi:hypothetical protein
MASCHFARARLTSERCDQRGPGGRNLLGATADLGHVALVIDDHHVADNANLVTVRGRIVERDGRNHARIVGVRDVDNGRAEVFLVGDVPDVSVTARDRDLSGARNVEMREAANLMRKRAGVCFRH